MRWRCEVVSWFREDNVLLSLRERKCISGSEMSTFYLVEQDGYVQTARLADEM